MILIRAWLNTTIKVQRRAANPSRNALNEPGYGAEASYPVAYDALAVRIEFWDENMEWTDTGERVVPTKLLMYVEADKTIKAEDRITVIASDATPIVGQLYIVTSVYPQWDSVGNVAYYSAELSIH